ncbi:B-cell antigen receptor complex-associated protein beta chain isoform X2 [Fukomys damarensis]|uniref:B-cell antigen receptor complex-associated protein beta chain isoform X2 n=1 Tax=Fukomys damarensis TaxID=885580 RepID=UPI000540145F|nr:B-cell antigen receptor complex-associated protein beta chain isoform X2 [Fukomys damarensis]
MAGLVLCPASGNWLMVLVLLISGEPVSPLTDEDLYLNPKEISSKVTWSWKQQQAKDEEISVVPQGKSRFLQTSNNTVHTLTIQGIQFEDNGIYFCQQQCDRKTGKSPSIIQGCGTELRVMGFSTLAQVKQRNTLKDGIIMIQTLLIILFIIVPIFLLLDKDDSKAGMEEDHTYEGLDIDQTATYEDIVTLRTGEVKWSVGEHPGQE